MHCAAPSVHQIFKGQTTVPYLKDDIDQLMHEHGVLLQLYGAAQIRCTRQAQLQSQEIERLQAQVIRLRAQLVMRDSAWAWVHEARQPPQSPPEAAQTGAWATNDSPGNATDLETLESNLLAADLVICQTGCIGHGAYWRVEDHCKRTGKPCVLVEQPDTLRIVRIHPSGRAEQIAPAAPDAVTGTSQEAHIAAAGMEPHHPG